MINLSVSQCGKCGAPSVSRAMKEKLLQFPLFVPLLLGIISGASAAMGYLYGYSIT